MTPDQPPRTPLGMERLAYSAKFGVFLITVLAVVVLTLFADLDAKWAAGSIVTLASSLILANGLEDGLAKRQEPRHVA